MGSICSKIDLVYNPSYSITKSLVEGFSDALCKKIYNLIIKI